MNVLELLNTEFQYFEGFFSSSFFFKLLRFKVKVCYDP